jgi:hypothetical protein
MYPPNHYFIRWRGQKSGPFPILVIEQKLDEHEIGLTCEIQYSGCWITLEEFFTAQDEQRKREAASQAIRVHPAPVQSSMPTTVPVLASASTLSPALAVPDRLAPPESSDFPAAAGRRRIVFALLGIFFGYLGAHNFYVGYTRIGILQLVLTGLAILLGFNLIFTWIWALVEVLFVHADSRGAPLS